MGGSLMLPTQRDNALQSALISAQAKEREKREGGGVAKPAAPEPSELEQLKTELSGMRAERTQHLALMTQLLDRVERAEQSVRTTNAALESWSAGAAQRILDSRNAERRLETLGRRLDRADARLAEQQKRSDGLHSDGIRRLQDSQKYFERLTSEVTGRLTRFEAYTPAAQEEAE